MATTKNTKINLLTPEAFAKKVTWLDDGCLSYDLTFSEDDIRKLPRYDHAPEYFTLEAVLADVCASPDERAGTDQHNFISEYFARLVEQGFALDWGGPREDDDIKNIPSFRVRSVVDRTCTLQAMIPLPNVERWLLNVTYAHWCNAIRKGDKLTEKQRNAIATIINDYMCATVHTFYFEDYFSLYEMQAKLDRAFDLMFHALRLPYVPTKWYTAQQKLAKARQARRAANLKTEQERERAEQAKKATA